jgi:hypothetical protein
MTCTKCLLFGFIATFLGACEPSGKVNQSDAQSADTDLLQHAARALPVLASRLRENLKLEGNIIVVAGSRANGFFAMSKNTPWTVSCGAGFSVYFDKAQIDLVFAGIQLNDQQCATLTVQTASAVRAVIGEPEKAENSN